MIGRRRFVGGLAGTGLATGLSGFASLGRAFAADAAAGKKPPRNDEPGIPIAKIPNHRQLMRELVIALADYTRKHVPPLALVVRGAPGLLLKGQRELDWEQARDPDGAQAAQRTPLGTVQRPYLKALDGLMVDGAFCGLEAYDKPTDETLALPLLQAAEVMRRDGKPVLSADYGRGAQAAAALDKARKSGFAAYLDESGDKRLEHIPAGRPPAENAEHVTDLGSVRNWLPLLRSRGNGSRDGWVKALAATNYDLLVIDPFWQDRDSLTADNVQALKYKGLGSRRLVFAGMPVGIAQDSRYYWQADWAPGQPPFLSAADPADAGRIFVEYWAPEWKEVLGTYIQGIAALGFDGVVLDAVDVYRHFEDLMPIDRTP